MSRGVVVAEGKATGEVGAADSRWGRRGRGGARSASGAVTGGPRVSLALSLLAFPHNPSPVPLLPHSGCRYTRQQPQQRVTRRGHDGKRGGDVDATGTVARTAGAAGASVAVGAGLASLSRLVLVGRRCRCWCWVVGGLAAGSTADPLARRLVGPSAGDA
ncbi:unnamed protein product [Closterium sp. Naga37s-1]|nr:unnamed protein product [Closterium sp. Naga37s-1]